jgi:hypothetical protein
MGAGQCIKTSRSVSVDADCTAQYVSKLAREGVLPHVVASDGTRLYPDDAAALVREIKAERLGCRGIKRQA